MHQRKQRCILRRVVSVVLEQHYKYTLSAHLYQGLAATARNAHAQACDFIKTAVVLEHHVKYALHVLLRLSHAAKRGVPMHKLATSTRMTPQEAGAQEGNEAEPRR